MGRPSKYKTDVQPYLADIKKWVASGATNEEIADAVGVNVSTLCKYKSQYPELKEAFTRGRAAVVCNIKAALLKKALGFYYEETRNSLKEGKDGTPQTYTEIYKRYCVPSETAAAMLLRNYDQTYHDGDAVTVQLKNQENELRRRIAESREILDD